MLISQHKWEALAYTIAGLTQSLGSVCGLRQTQLACILTMLRRFSGFAGLIIYSVCCIFCQVGNPHSGNSHGCHQAWSCHSYEFA